MEKNKNMCQKVEMCVFSDEEPTEELKKHAQQCEHCRKFLEQNSLINEELKKLDICNIADGEIADAVMKKVQKEKKARGVRFDFTHHLGTAAALVIICAVALYVKNVNPNVNVGDEQVKYTEQAQVSEDKAPVLLNTKITPVNDEVMPENESETEYGMDGGAYYDLEAPIGYYSLTDDDMSQNGLNNYTDGVDGQDASLTKAMPEEKPVKLQFAPKEADIEGLQEPLYDQPAMEDSSAMNTAISSGSGILMRENNDADESIEKINDCEEKYSDTFLVFDGIEFLPGDENIQKNVESANARLAELYGEGYYVISAFCLENNGWNGNAFFTDYAPDMTYSYLMSLQGASATITGK